MNPNLQRAFTCYRRPSHKHMMRLVRRHPWVTYGCEACHYMFHPEGIFSRNTHPTGSEAVLMTNPFTCYRRPSHKHMMRFVRRYPWVTYRCEACHYRFLFRPEGIKVTRY